MRSRDPMSADTLLAALTDDEAMALVPGDVVIVETTRGLAPLTVDRVRPGIAFTDANPPDAYEVPVVEARGLVWSPDDLYLPAPTAVATEHRPAPHLGGVSPARPSNRVGDLRDPYSVEG